MEPVQRALAQLGLRTPFKRDALLAALVVLIGLVGTWLNFDVDTATAVTDMQLLRLLGCSVAVVTGGSALAWRRRIPVTVAVVAALALVVETAVAPDLEVASVSVWIALYNVGAFADRVHAAMVVIGTALATSVTALVVSPGEVTTDTTLAQISAVASASSFAAVGGYGVVALVGAYVQMRRAYRAELVARAERLALEREERAERAVAEEQTRIARELHDVVAHHLSGIVVQASAAERVVEDNPVQVRETLRFIADNGRETLTSMRGLISMLRERTDSDGTAPQPTLAMRDQLLARAAAAGLAVTVEVTGEPVELRPDVDLAAYRVLQEALTNAGNHAPGAEVRVGLDYRVTEVGIRVADSGPRENPAPHLDADQHGTGVGLVGMRERVHLLGGDFRAGPRKDGGWLVRARVPNDASHSSSAARFEEAPDG